MDGFFICLNIVDFIDSIDVAVGEGVTELLVLKHLGCRYYDPKLGDFDSPEAEKSKNIDDAVVLRRIIQEEFPQLKVRIFWMDLVRDHWLFEEITA